MKRDPELIRTILLEVEKWPPNHPPREVGLKGWDQPTINRHIQLLEEDGYLIASIADYQEHGSIGGAFVQRMTGAGHDLLDSIRDEGVWDRVKAQTAKVGGGVSLEVLQALAITAVKTRLGLAQD